MFILAHFEGIIGKNKDKNVKIIYFNFIATQIIIRIIRITL